MSLTNKGSPWILVSLTGIPVSWDYTVWKPHDSAFSNFWPVFQIPKISRWLSNRKTAFNLWTKECRTAHWCGRSLLNSTACYLLYLASTVWSGTRGRGAFSVADPECLSRIRIFPSRIPGQKDSGSRIRIHIKDLSIFNPKIVSKLLAIWSKIFIPDPDLEFLPIPEPGVKKAPGIPDPDPQHWELRDAAPASTRIHKNQSSAGNSKTSTTFLAFMI
jgi:hypothetical protein